MVKNNLAKIKNFLFSNEYQKKYKFVNEKKEQVNFLNSYTWTYLILGFIMGMLFTAVFPIEKSVILFIPLFIVGMFLEYRYHNIILRDYK